MSGGQDPLGRVLAAFPGARATGTGWQARCPSHEDRRASLSLSVGDDGTALIYCHAGCDPQNVIQAAGLDWADLFPESSSRRTGPAPRPAKRRVVAQYDYRTPDGALDFQVVRLEPKDFRQRRPDPTLPDGWAWKSGNKDLVYRLPELLAAPAEAWVFVVEGEKDVDRLRALGLVATCNAGGAGKWRPAHGKHLRGRRVAILPDNDDAGREHAVQVATSAEGLAAELRVVELPELPSKGDVSDWLAAGGTAAQLVDLVDAAPRWRSAPDDPDSCPCGTVECAAREQRFRQRLAELEQHQSLTMEALANPHLSAVEKIAGLALAFQVFSSASRGQPEPIIVRDQLAERAGVSADTAGRAVEALCGDEGLFDKRTERAAEDVVNPETGEIRQVLRRDRKVTRYRARYQDLGATLRAIRDHRPAERPKHGGKRVPRCPDHPLAGIVTERVIRCADSTCGRELERSEPLYTQVAATSPRDHLTVVSTTQPQDAGTRAPRSDGSRPLEPSEWTRLADLVEKGSTPHTPRHPVAGRDPAALHVFCSDCGDPLDWRTGRCVSCQGPPIGQSPAAAAQAYS